ncbi:hypothetical protein RHD99_05390 [Buttiauxella selenatireducens]|uniref:Morphogenetic protein n=1 Tax=Buttiauxella selenatireducens TaxID=3073902 RepID=A0ABY9SD22_9ENTR|nr:hypothetical protein [Buttiauxella sp. R73]WMY75394.1 hypothetical protein RHD99_05390 [Buttiauxella sp. R73]
MKERGMIFNGEMVRAILDGRKTQTRRVMKVQPKQSETRPGDFWFSSNKLKSMVHVSDLIPGNSPITDYHLFLQEHCCPFGSVGDRIWVRETFRVMGCATDVARLMYKASERNSFTESTRTVPVATCTKQPLHKWTPSIHMPRWASRILLEITAVRVERLNAVTEDDARAEGVSTAMWFAGKGVPEDEWENLAYTDQIKASHTNKFATLWESIYGEKSWQANPWVWVIEFRRVEATDEQ